MLDDESGFEIAVEICTRTLHTVPLNKLREWAMRTAAVREKCRTRRIRDKAANWRLRWFRQCRFATIHLEFSVSFG
jgi:hypothetical protein